MKIKFGILFFSLLIVSGCTKLTCPTDYELKDDNCYKEVETESILQKTCSKDETLENDKCIKTLTEEPDTSYVCPSGYKLLGSDCLKTIVVKAEKYIYCAAGFKEEDGKCVSNGSIGVPPANSTKTLYICPEGYIQGDQPEDKCEKTETKKATSNMTCSKGYKLEGIKCIFTETKDPVEKPGCEDDYELKNNKCYKQEKIKATKK